MRSPTWYSSVGTRSRFGSSASYLPRSRITSERSNRRTVPLTMSPTRSLNSRENQRLLRLPDLHHERLLGVLRGDAAKAGGRDFLFDFVADLGVRLDAARVENGDLVVLGNDLFGNDELGERLDVAVFLVNLHAQFARRADGLSWRRKATPPGRRRRGHHG